MDNELATGIGWRISELMKLHKVNAEKLAEQTALPVSYLALIERGMRLPD